MRGALSGRTLRVHELYTLRWQHALERCGAGASRAAQLADEYLAVRRRHYRLFPDVPEVLPRLCQEYRVAVLTNGLSDFQREKIASVDLERWISTIFVSGEIELWKPAAEVYRHVLADLGSAPEETVMVGDSLRHDITGAAEAGLRTVWVRRHQQLSRDDVRPDAAMADLHLLPELLSGW